MLIEKEIKIDDLSYYESIPENALCFDIETTGLNRKTTHTTVIGCGHVQKEHIIFRQWLLEDPSKERDMLREFSSYIKSFRAVLQFNGNSFDMPYIRERCSILGLDDPFQSMEYIDYYVSSKKFRKILGLESLRQKSFETLFNIKRKDKLSGSQCITAYKAYLKYGDQGARDALLLHNEEDVTGLLKLNGLGVLGRLICEDKMLNIRNAYLSSADEKTFIVEFALQERLPFMIDHSDRFFRLKMKDNSGILLLKGSFGCLKYFFANPGDYFYLPLEDHAIHKSVGIYIDKKERCKATRDNCYEKSSGIFFFQPKDILKPAMRYTYKDKYSFVNGKALKNASCDQLASLVREFICM